MIDLRKIGIIFVIAALTAIFITVTSEAIYPNPDYNDYCDIQPKQDYEYDPECYGKLNEAQQKHDLILFLSNSILGGIAIIAGMLLPKKNYHNIYSPTMHEWVGTGLLFGGLIAIFIGTGMYFHNLGRYIKPIVIFIELVLVIFLSYKKLNTY